MKTISMRMVAASCTMRARIIWYGEKRDSKGSQGVNVYSSKDLYNWQFEALAFSPVDGLNSDITWGCIMERPKVIYNPKPKNLSCGFILSLRDRVMTPHELPLQ